MNFITATDGTPIFFKDWSLGPVVTFSHGLPLNADARDGQMHFFTLNGHANDPATFLETLDLLAFLRR